MPGSFSLRRGIERKPEELQLESMDDELCNGLWHVLNERIVSYSEVHSFAALNDYILHFRLSPGESKQVYILKSFQWHAEKTFYQNWNKVYDLIEWALNRMDWPAEQDRMAFLINKVLEEENGGYRISKDGDKYIFIPITDKTEMGILQETNQQTQTKALSKIHQYLEKARTLCFHRKSPQYEASIVASFNACESAVKYYLDQSKGTLGEMLKSIPNDDMPEPLKSGFKKYYGYGSEYVRHGQADTSIKKRSKEHLPSFAEAKFFLVASHAFINYLVAKKK